jgi:hypothetical protein
MPAPVLYTPLSEYLSEELWPSDLFTPSEGSFLDRIAYEDGMIVTEEGTFSARLALRVMDELSFQLPLGFAFVLGAGPVVASADTDEDGLRAAIYTEVLKLRLPRTLFKPVVEQDGKPVADPDPTHFVDIPLPLGVSIDGDFNIDIEWPGESPGQLSLPRCMVGDSGVIISAENILLRLSSNQDLPDAAAAIGLDTDWHGLFVGEATVELPEGLPQLAPEELLLEDAVIGPAGVSGRLEAQYTPEFDTETKRFVGRGSGELGGVPFAFSSIAVELRDNNLVEASLAGQMLLPFFDQLTGVTITLHGDGSFSVDIGGGTPLATIEREKLLRLTVEHIGFEVIDGRLLVHTGGTVTLLIGDEEWPTFRADDISIDADGDITVHGVGLTLRDGKPLDLDASPAGIGRVPGVTIDKLDLSGNPLDDGLIADAELSTVTKLGPFIATLQRIGVHARLAARLAGPGAVVGDLSFRPPAGIGLEIDAKAVTGAGYLDFYPERSEYIGAAQLRIKDKIQVKAIGLILTKPEVSSLLLVSAEFPPVQLGLGFKLNGVGGLAGVHRGINEEQLFAGLRDNTLDDLLFPADPLQNIHGLLGKLNGVFPPAQDRYTFGLMGLITWGGGPRIWSPLNWA